MTFAGENGAGPRSKKVCCLKSIHRASCYSHQEKPDADDVAWGDYHGWLNSYEEVAEWMAQFDIEKLLDDNGGLVSFGRVVTISQLFAVQQLSSRSRAKCRSGSSSSCPSLWPTGHWSCWRGSRRVAGS